MSLLRLQKGACIPLINKSFRSSKYKSRTFWKVTVSSHLRALMVLPSFLQRKRMGDLECALTIVYLINRQKMMFSRCLELMNFCPVWMGQEFLVNWI